MHSKFMKGHQCFLERSYAVLIELNSNQGLVLFRQTQIFRSTLTLITHAFAVSQPKILQKHFFNQVSFPARDVKRNWVKVSQ